MTYTTGIYKITNTINNKCYIGSSTKINVRWSNHKSALKRNKHTNKHLQTSYNNHGLASFTYEVLLYCDVKDLLFYEQRAIDKYNPEYNMNTFAERHNHTEASKKKMSIAAMGKQRNLGNKHTEETKQKLREAGLRQVVSEKAINSMIAANTGKSRSIETKQKISIIHKGKTVSGESRQKISIANIGKIVSEETKQKMKHAANKRFFESRCIKLNTLIDSVFA